MQKKYTRIFVFGAMIACSVASGAQRWQGFNIRRLLLPKHETIQIAPNNREKTEKKPITQTSFKLYGYIPSWKTAALLITVVACSYAGYRYYSAPAQAPIVIPIQADVVEAQRVQDMLAHRALAEEVAQAGAQVVHKNRYGPVVEALVKFYDHARGV